MGTFLRHSVVGCMVKLWLKSCKLYVWPSKDIHQSCVPLHTKSLPTLKSAILFRYIYLCMFVCKIYSYGQYASRSRLKIVYTSGRLSHRSQQASTRTALRHPIVRVSRSVSPTVLWGCHAIYHSILISHPCEDMRSGAEPAKNDYRFV